MSPSPSPAPSAPRAAPRAPRGAPPKSRRGLLVGAIVAALVVAALVIALVASGGDDGETQASTVPAASGPGSVTPAEQQPVTVTGDALPELPREGTDPAVGLAPPAISGYSFDGSPQSVTPGGTAKMVIVLAHWCPHCNAEVPRLLDWKAQGRIPEGLEIVGVATGTDPSSPKYPPSQWLSSFPWAWPVLADSETFDAARAYGVNGYPFFVVVGTDGLVKARFSGEAEVDVLDAVVREALGVPPSS